MFKAFSYLGAYPNPGPVPLTLEAFTTAFVVLSGKRNADEHDPTANEDIFFDALAIPNPKAALQEETPPHDDRPKTAPPASAAKITPSPSGDMSLASLGVTFDELDLDTTTQTAEDTSPRVLCRDLRSLFILFLWIVKEEMKEGLIKDAHLEAPDPGALRTTADHLVRSLATVGEDSVSRDAFKVWRDRNAPALFRAVQSFIYSKFDLTSTLVLEKDVVPVPAQTDILHILHCAMLSWCLPPPAIQQWERLYSAREHGFSMNRFESHVFRYPGPTLLILQGDTGEQEDLILGAYLTEKWKQSRHFWGSSDCFVFELSPTLEAFRALPDTKKKNDQYVYYHEGFGLGFGGTTHKQHPTTSRDVLLWLSDTLQDGTFIQELYPASPTLAHAQQRPSFEKSFETINVEVFGLGDAKARQQQERAWEFEKREALRRSGLQLRHGDQEMDRELLRMAGIINDENRQER